MPPRDSLLRVRDILDAIRRIAVYTESLTYGTFTADEKTIDAVIRNIAVIGEASRALPDEFKGAHADLP